MLITADGATVNDRAAFGLTRSLAKSPRTGDEVALGAQFGNPDNGLPKKSDLKTNSCGCFTSVDLSRSQ